jgi:hypothetical protein
MRLPLSVRATAAGVFVAVLTLCGAACEQLKPDQSTREATSEAEVARLATEARPVQTLLLLGPGITDSALARCAYVRALEVVFMRDCNAVTAAGLSELAKVRQLSQLTIGECAGLDGVALLELQHLPKLAALRVYQPRIDGRMIEAVAHCAALRSLLLAGEFASDTDLRALAALRSLELIDLGNARGVSAAMLADLRAALPSCTVIDPR